MPEPSSPRQDFPVSRGFVTVMIVLVVVVIVIGLLPPAASRVDHAAARSQSLYNIKQILLAFHNTVSTTDMPLPPAYGRYSPMGEAPTVRPNGTGFFHILPCIEQGNVYAAYWTAADAIPTTVYVKTFYAPLDTSNPGNDSSTSYALNAALLGTEDGGTWRLSDLTNGKGTSCIVLTMERFAQTGDPANAASQHHWHRIGKDQCSVYEEYANASGMPNPVFGATPATAAVDNTGHAFSSAGIQVGLADGSCRLVSQSVNTVGSVAGAPTASVWEWACSGPSNKAMMAAPVPDGW